jgi:AhpC/TSA family
MAGTKFTVIDGGRPVELDEADGVARATRAEKSGRPVAIDRDEHAAYLGVSAAERAKALASLEAPDFTLPDLDGRLHSLSEHRGKKVLLVAYASW